MMNYIYLIIAVLFILLVLIIESSNDDYISKSIWIPILWMMYCGSRAIAYWIYSKNVIIGTEELSYYDGSLIDRIVLLVMMVCGIIILIRRNICWKILIKNNKWIIILFLYMGTSAFWSNFPELTLKRWFRSIGDMIMVLIVLSEKSPKECIYIVIRRTSIILIPMSIILIKYFRHVGVAYTTDGLGEMWVGVTTHKNSLGALSLIGGLYFIYNILNRKNNKHIIIDIIYIIMIVWLLYGSPTSNSKTSIACFLYGLSMILLFKCYKNKNEKLMRILFYSSFIVAALWIFMESPINILLDLTGRDKTLTGRTDLWNDLITIGKQNLYLGYGYGAFWGTDLQNNLWDKYSWGPTQGHNGYIDVFLQLGYIGLTLMSIVIYKSYINVKNYMNINGECTVLFFIIYIIILFHNITESSYIRSTNYIWFVFLMLSINYEINRNSRFTNNDNNFSAG